MDKIRLQELYHDAIGAMSRPGIKHRLSETDILLHAGDRSPKGCYQIFHYGFINDQMDKDLPYIIRSYLKQEMLKEDFLDFKQGDQMQMTPAGYMMEAVLRDALEQALTGSESHKAYLIYLYKTYHKKEYKQLNRFQKLSKTDILAFTNPESANFITDCSRVLVMAELLSIQILESCEYFYILINQVEKDEKPDEYPIKDLPEDFVKESNQWGNQFRFHKYPKEFARMCISMGNLRPEFVFSSPSGIDETASLILAKQLLRSRFPNHEFSDKELEIYGMMCFVISHLSYIIVGEQIFLRNFSCIESPKDPFTWQEQTEEKQENVSIPEIETKEDETLKKELDEKEQLIQQMEEEQEQQRQEIRRLKSQLDDYDNMKKEITALRNHVYKISENDISYRQEEIGELVKKLCDKKIVIIGGHKNWKSYLRKYFPDWIYLNPESSGSVNENVIQNADYVYFFTDYISHSTYQKFIRKLRGLNISYGYIHSTNIENNIRQIAREVISERI